MSGPDSNLTWLFERQRFGIREGLEGMRALLERLGSPERRIQSVLVGGTNGKGSVASLLAAALTRGGRRTGLFVSPHLQRVGERAALDGRPAEDAEMEALVGEVRRPAEEVGATFFEVLTAAALLRFARAGVDYAVLEVGMGGRLDATNVTDPVLGVITGVALDHTAILGSSLTAVAEEKAGILRPGVPLITGAGGEALEVIERRARDLGTPLLAEGRGFRAEALSHGWEGVRLKVHWEGWPAAGAASVLGRTGELEVASPLVGRHQVGNVALAALAALQLGVPPATVQEALAGARWPGRLERIPYRGRFVVLDGAHNPQAARALARSIRELEGRVAAMVVAVSSDKDVRGLLEPLSGLARSMLFTRAVRSPRSLEPAALLRAWRDLGADAPGQGGVAGSPPAAAPDPAAALELALEAAGSGETIVVAGSLFLVGEARDLLKGAAPEPFERWQ